MTVSPLDERIRVCRRRLEAAPDSRAFAPLADLLRQAGRIPEALALLEDGVARHPDFHGGLVILGHALLDAGRLAHAERVLTRVLEHDADNLVARRLLAERARDAGHWSEAAAHFEYLAGLEPDNGTWTAAAAAARECLDAAGEAAAVSGLAEGDEAASPDPVGGATPPAGETAPVADGAGRAVEPPGSGRPGPDRRQPGDGLITLTLVDIYIAQGYRAKALAALQRLHELAPDRDDVRERIVALGPVTTDDAPRDGTVAASRNEHLAARRAAEKRSFADWIDRIRGDEEGAAP
ncbi:tetratricopeptide repeat protein [bacterium]|nr:tetratricopeptide repeat protein [bacterium]